MENKLRATAVLNKLINDENIDIPIVGAFILRQSNNCGPYNYAIDIIAIKNKKCYIKHMMVKKSSYKDNIKTMVEFVRQDMSADADV